MAAEESLPPSFPFFPAEERDSGVVWPAVLQQQNSLTALPVPSPHPPASLNCQPVVSPRPLSCRTPPPGHSSWLERQEASASSTGPLSANQLPPAVSQAAPAIHKAAARQTTRPANPPLTHTAICLTESQAAQPVTQDSPDSQPGVPAANCSSLSSPPFAFFSPPFLNSPPRRDVSVSSCGPRPCCLSFPLLSPLLSSPLLPSPLPSLPLFFLLLSFLPLLSSPLLLLLLLFTLPSSLSTFL